MSNSENLGYRWELRMQASIVVLVVAVLAASRLPQLGMWRGLRRMGVAMIVRERSR
jgi:hypothetical protein